MSSTCYLRICGLKFEEIHPGQDPWVLLGGLVAVFLCGLCNAMGHVLWFVHVLQQWSEPPPFLKHSAAASASPYSVVEVAKNLIEHPDYPCLTTECLDDHLGFYDRSLKGTKASLGDMMCQLLGSCAHRISGLRSWLQGAVMMAEVKAIEM